MSKEKSKRKPPISLDGFVAVPHRARKSHERDLRPRRRLDNFSVQGDASTASAAPAKFGSSGSSFKPRSQRNAASADEAFIPNYSYTAPSPILATKKRRRRRRSLRKTIGISITILLLIPLIAGSLLAGKGYFKFKKVFGGDSGNSALALQRDIAPEKLKGEGDGRVNIVVFGKGGPTHEGGDLTDTILIASLDPLQKDAALISIPRDLYVKTDMGSMKINAVYSLSKQSAARKGAKPADAEKAGIAASEKVLQQVLGIPLHYYAMVDFTAFRNAIDTVGGIDIDVKTAVYDPTFAWEYGALNVKVGKQHFDGLRALLYARSRHTSLRGDFDRSERQREIIVALKDKVLSAGTFANPVKMSSLLDAFGNHVQTDLTINEVSRLYSIGKEVGSDKISSIGLADPPNNYLVTDNINGLSVVVPREGLYSYTAINNYIRNAVKDGFLKNDNATIAIYNGTTTAGLATKKANELKSFGYNVTIIADAPTKNYTQTTLIDLTKTKKYTKRYLEQRLAVTAGTVLPDPKIQPAAADFVIILGQNESTSE